MCSQHSSCDETKPTGAEHGNLGFLGDRRRGGEEGSGARREGDRQDGEENWCWSCQAEQVDHQEDDGQALEIHRKVKLPG